MILSFYKCTLLIEDEVIEEERDGGRNLPMQIS
jgi:hypothetical protein